MSTRRPSPTASSDELLLVLVFLAAGTAGAVWGAVRLATLGQHPPPPSNPFNLASELLKGTYHWPATATVWLIGECVALVLLATLVLLAARRSRRQRHHVDTYSRNLLRDRGIDRYTVAKAAPMATQHLGPGPQIGRIVGTKQVLRATWEDVLVEIAGARMGKTTSVVIPAVLNAPGAVYVTSNKRDVVDATRGPRAAVGSVWVFDPQRIAGTDPTFWWNPLDMAGDVTGARTLAGLFSSATRPPSSSTDAYFDPEGEELLAMLLLAAASGSLPLTVVYRWLNDAREDHAVALLMTAGHELASQAVRGVLSLPDKQRAGVMGTAKKMIGFIADPALAVWVVDPHSQRPRFDASRFLNERSTLYSLSKEGPGSAGPLTAALTAAVLAAAERKASHSPAGRLPVPLVSVLDEVANVCRWRELPDLYSHYGSRGIVLMSFLQSWSQGVECWGREGMKKLWGAANLRVYGGGVNDAELLEDISRMCGEYDAPTSSSSYRNGQRTTTAGERPQRIFDVATLAALPAGRAVVMLSGARPVLVATESCHDGPYADQVRQSIGRYGTPT